MWMLFAVASFNSSWSRIPILVLLQLLLVVFNEREELDSRETPCGKFTGESSSPQQKTCGSSLLFLLLFVTTLQNSRASSNVLNQLTKGGG